jgi:hypothetical protein
MAEDDGGQYDLPSAKKPIRTRLTPELMRAIRKIESGGNPNARTGSYKGLYQLSDKEFARLGGRGDIFNPQENERIATLKLQQEADQVSKKLGRELTPGEVYLVHQQGVGGAYEHLTNPNRPAWQSMHATGEGRNKGEGWSRLAIWGNVPDKDKARYGSVDNLTSGEFTRLWNERIARGGGGDSGSGGTVTPAVTAAPAIADAAGGPAEGGVPEATPTPVAPAGTGGIGSDAARAPAQSDVTDTIAKVENKTKSQDIADAFGDALSKLGAGYAGGPIAQNARTATGSGLVPMTQTTPTGPIPTSDPRQADAQRQQLAMVLQRLNSGRLF